MLKSLLILLVQSALAVPLQSGHYLPTESNNDSVCPQQVQVQGTADVSYLKVVYVGDCYYQGPYFYSCDDSQCGDQQIEYMILSPTQYLWTNKVHQIWGKFELSKNYE